MPPLVGLWDAEDVLGVGQVSSGATCVGYAKPKRRHCHHRVAAANCQQASDLLLQISSMNISASGVDHVLERLARLLLCHPWNHQDQVGVVAAKWRDRVQQFQIVAAARLETTVQLENEARRGQVAPDEEGVRLEDAVRVERAARRPRNSHSKHAARTHIREVEAARQDAEIARRDAEIARRDLTIALQDIEIARRETAIARQETEVARKELRSLRNRNLRVSDAFTQQVAAVAGVRGGAATPALTVEFTRPNSTASSTHRPRQNQFGRHVASPTAIPPAATRTLAVPSPAYRLLVPPEEDSGSIVGDCSICLQRLGNEGLVRCEARCRQPFHGECMNAWLQVRRRCPLW